MKRLIVNLGILLALCAAALAQEQATEYKKHEITVQGSGFFQRETTSNGITSKPTSSGGVMAGYRYNVKKYKWLAFEGNYDYFRNSQKYFTSAGAASGRTNVHVFTGSTVIKLPAVHHVNSFVLAGVGAMRFNPRDTNLIGEQTRTTFVYGGGADLPMSAHLKLRAQYRGMIYKVPDFDSTALRLDKYTHTAVPSAGVVFSF